MLVEIGLDSVHLFLSDQVALFIKLRNSLKNKTQEKSPKNLYNGWRSGKIHCNNFVGKRVL